jgi:type II secretory pathway pseudopilin PulG
MFGSKLKSSSLASRRASQGRSSDYRIAQLRNRKMRSERGYVLLILLLAVAFLSILSLKVIEDFKYQSQRDREEEMIHRGCQYTRAVKRYFKKFGRYPTRIEDLESTNRLRFLRKRYKDPMNRDPATGKERDFKFLHLTDIQSLSNSQPVAGFAPVSQITSEPGAGASVANGTPGQPGSMGPGAVAGAPSQQAPGDQSDASPADQEAAAAPPPQPLSQQVGSNGAPQVFGGGAIVGVASLKKDQTIREFNKKNHYNQWQFIYDPTTDRGGLVKTPYQPPLLGATQNQPQPNGPPGQPSFGPSQGVNTQPQQPQQPNPSPDQQ